MEENSEVEEQTSQAYSALQFQDAERVFKQQLYLHDWNKHL